jgi:hypothetical protein
VQRIEQHPVWQLRTRGEAAHFWAAKYAHLGATMANVVEVPAAFREPATAPEAGQEQGARA